MIEVTSIAINNAESIRDKYEPIIKSIVNRISNGKANHKDLLKKVNEYYKRLANIGYRVNEEEELVPITKEWLDKQEDLEGKRADFLKRLEKGNISMEDFREFLAD